MIETVLPETDDQAVRILTVHGAKGLEFPITVLSGLTSQLAWRSTGVQVLFPPTGGWALRLKKDIETPEFKEFLPIEEQMDQHERLRLLYVVATRARDHLIVSVHRKEGDTTSTAATLFHDRGWEPSLVEVLAFAPETGQAAMVPVPEPAHAELPSHEEWERAHAAALASGMRLVAVCATQLAEEAARIADTGTANGLQKEPRDIDLPPWQKGRYGSAVGRAVHAVLQTIGLRSGEGLSEAAAAQAAAAQAAAEGVLGKENVIEALCRSALASESSSAPRSASTGARSTSASLTAMASSRATSTCSTATMTASLLSTTRPTPGVPRRTSRQRSSATGCSSTPTHKP